jgi:hypothetical protein
VLGEPLNHLGPRGGWDASFESHFLVKKFMEIDIRLRVRSAPSPLGPILPACGILAAIASRMRLVGVPIFSFGQEVFLLSCGLFLSGCSRMRVEPQKSQSLESSGY